MSTEMYSIHIQSINMLLIIVMLVKQYPGSSPLALGTSAPRDQWGVESGCEVTLGT